jgi:hypothetical protein
MPHKQIPHSIPPNNPAPMQLNRLLLRKPMHDQQLVQGIIQGSHGRESRKYTLANLQRCSAKASVNEKSLVGPVTKYRRAKVELKF